MIYTINKVGYPILLWTNTKEYGHYGIEKLVFRVMGIRKKAFSNPYSDDEGKSITQWCFAFVAPQHEHKKYKKTKK